MTTWRRNLPPSVSIPAAPVSLPTTIVTRTEDGRLPMPDLSDLGT
ncbi:MAG: hypothetical protein ACI8S6_001496, partial [Myxococcota bacterium]